MHCNDRVEKLDVGQGLKEGGGELGQDHRAAVTQSHVLALALDHLVVAGQEGQAEAGVQQEVGQHRTDIVRSQSTGQVRSFHGNELHSCLGEWSLLLLSWLLLLPKILLLP